MGAAPLLPNVNEEEESAASSRQLRSMDVLAGVHVLLVGPFYLTKLFGAALLKASSEDDDATNPNSAKTTNNNQSFADQVDAHAIRALERLTKARQHHPQKSVHVYMKESVATTKIDASINEKPDQKNYDHVILVTSCSSQECHEESSDSVYRLARTKEWMNSFLLDEDIISQRATIVISLDGSGGSQTTSANEQHEPNQESLDAMTVDDDDDDEAPGQESLPTVEPCVEKEQEWQRIQQLCIPIFCWDNNNDAVDGQSQSIKSVARLVWKRCCLANRIQHPACSPLLLLPSMTTTARQQEAKQRDK